MKDSFHTFSYHGGYVHTCWNRSNGREEIVAQFKDGTRRPATSLRAAKRMLRAAQS